MIMTDFKKDPTVTAVFNSLGSDSSIQSFENAQGKTTYYRPCTILYKGNVVRATIWESVVAQGVKLNEECIVALSKYIDRNNVEQIACKVIGGSAMLPTAELFADAFAEEKELSI